VDLPGANEKDNPVVKLCMKQALSMCTALFVIVAPKDVQSDGLATLVETIEQDAPHLLENKRAVTFVISQIDTLRPDESDDDSDGVSAKMVEHHKRILRTFLSKRLPSKSSWLERVVILATSVSGSLAGGHEFHKLFDVIVEYHAIVTELCYTRKKVLTANILEAFDAFFEYPSYPVYAESALNTEKTNKDFWVKAGVASAVVTIPLGGMAFMYACVVRGAAAAVAFASSVISMAKAADKVTLCGNRLIGLPNLRAEGVAVAIGKVLSNMKKKSDQNRLRKRQRCL